jgi:hypothetical protein
MELVAHDAGLARRLGEAGRKKVETSFSSERSAEMLARMLGR